MLISYSQNGEDIFLYRCFKDINSGFYIDVGANLPEDESVTKLFYDKGWHGVNIEPDPYSFKLLNHERPLDLNINICVSETEENLEFYQVKETGLSSLLKKNALLAEEIGYKFQKIIVKGKKLSTILNENNLQKKEIHFLKIDTEGSEEHVIKSLDFTIYKPWVIIIESISPHTHKYISIEVDKLLVMNGYKKAYFDGLNSYFIRNDKYNLLKENFYLPINIFDGFIKIDEYRLRNKLSDTENKLTNTENEIKEIESRDLVLSVANNSLHEILVENNVDINNLQNIKENLKIELNEYYKKVQRYEVFLSKLPIKILVVIYKILSRIKQFIIRKSKQVIKKILRFVFKILSNSRLIKKIYFYLK